MQESRFPKKSGDDVEMEDEDEQNQTGGLTSSGLILTTCYKLAINAEHRLTTGDDMLTDFFRGGFVPKKLYEIYGESGSGKYFILLKFNLFPQLYR